MFTTIKRAVNRHLYNIPGFRTRRHIVVIESDDWGAIRTAGREAFRACLQAGYHPDLRMFERYDMPAGADDLTALFDVLHAFRDRNGRHPILTANTIVANPDFNKIAASAFGEYAYEPFTATLEHYHPGQNVFGLWRQGMSEGFFRPQFHGREHFNIPRWLDALRADDEDALFAFRLGMVGLAPKVRPERGNPLQVALASASREQFDFQLGALLEGLDLFERLFGYRSQTFIAPCYTWPLEIEQPLLDHGIKLLQGAFTQKLPDGGMKPVRHYTGQRNAAGQYYTVRNCNFEPSRSVHHRDAVVARCLREIGVAFFWHKPAIICSHRFNYIGGLDERNRTTNLQLLRELLTEILRRYPDAEFLSSDEMLPLLSQSESNDGLRDRTHKHPLVK